MATLIDGRIVIEDASGNRVSGGKLRIYETGTTNLADVFSDSGLTTPLPNPVVANSAGVCPQVYGEAGLVVDCAMLTSADVEISGRSFTMTLLGSTSTGAEYDFGNSRGKLSGSGGVFSIEAGDMAGDDTGGQMRLGGWGGTQADSIELDAAAVDTTGTFTENGKELPGVVQTSSTSSGAATVIIALPNTNPEGCRVYEVDIIDIVCASSGSITGTFSFDNGATYDATGYYASSSKAPTSNAGVTSGGSANDTSAAITSMAAAPTAAQPAHMHFKLITPNTTTGTVSMVGVFCGGSLTSGEEGTHAPFRAMQETNGGRCTHIKLTFPGTVSCTYRVVPLRGFGE